MESTLVIKVKYGEMLRRFSVRVHENNKLDIDINGLRAKIRNLFNFSPDSDVTLTYIDEDGDIVTLVNDDDLHDVMRQQLKFLRIDVHLRNEKNDQSHNRSDGSSTPLTSAHGQRSFQNVRTGISEVLKSLPEPLPEFCSQIFLDFASKAALTSPVLAELAQSFIRLGNTHLNSDSQSSFVSEMSTQHVATESSMAPLGADSKASKDDGFHQEKRSNFKRTDSASKDSKIINTGSVTKNIGVDAPASVDLNALPHDYSASGCAIGKSAIVAPSSTKKEAEKCNDAFLSHLQELHVSSLSASKHNNPHSSPTTYVDGSFDNDCPFSGVPVATGTSVPRVMDINPVSSSSGYTEPMGIMFHKGVICDGCGARPITGPRFKSKVKENYDLCIICFAEMGNGIDYIRIDRPLSCRHPRMKAFNRRHPLAGPRVIDIWKSCGKQTRLDSCFIADVNVLDGTVMAPSTPFTKIWRLRNNGGLNWPRGTQLVRAGGDLFCVSDSVEIVVPAGGLPVDQEIEIAVDFIAPPLSGKYISYWRMASPAGQMFGQRVWVLIQVDEALVMPHSDNSHALDLNLPPIAIGSGGSKGHADAEKNSTPAIADGVLYPPRDSSPLTEPVKADHNLSENEKKLQFLINEALLVGTSPATPANEDNLVSSYPVVDGHGVLPCLTEAPSVSYPLIDFSEPIPTVTPLPVSSSMVSPASSEKVSAINVVEETLLATLEDMGFKQVDLNKEVLKRNEYDLEKSVDELCGVVEWDPFLEELEEMGFGNKEMNKMLLMKNNGSMKRVVMDLISGEKA